MKNTCAGIGNPMSACLSVLFRRIAPPFSDGSFFPSPFFHAPPQRFFSPKRRFPAYISGLSFDFLLRASKKGGCKLLLAAAFCVSINPAARAVFLPQRGEFEGAKPASNRIKCRAKPCFARRAWSEASIFVPLRGTKITALFQAVEKSRRLFRQPEKAAANFCLQPPFASNHFIFSIFSLSFCPTPFSFRLADCSPS